MRVPRVKWVNWKKVHRENVKEDEYNSLRERRERRRNCILSMIKDGDVTNIKKILSDIDRYGCYEKKERTYSYYSDYVQIIALRFVAYKYGLGFELRECANWISKTYDVVLTRKS